METILKKLKKGKATLLFILAYAKAKQCPTDLINYERNISPNLMKLLMNLTTFFTGIDQNLSSSITNTHQKL